VLPEKKRKKREGTREKKGGGMSITSPLERSDLNNIGSQSWYDAACPRSTCLSTLSCLFIENIFIEKSVTIGSKALKEVRHFKIFQR